MNLRKKRVLAALLVAMAVASVGCSKKSKNRSRPAPTSKENVKPEPNGEKLEPIPADEDNYFKVRDGNEDGGEEFTIDTGDDGKGPVVIDPNKESAPETPQKTVTLKKHEGKYPTIEKDVLYGEDQPPTYTDEGRLTEFGAVMTDDPRWFPGLPDFPAGHERSKVTTIYTGGVSSSGFKFTDGKSDKLMDYLVDKVNQLDPSAHADFHKDIISESKKLAQRISDVRLSVDQRHTGTAKIEVEFVDGATNKPVRIFMHGPLSASRKVRLQQVDIKGDKDLKFYGDLTCMDTDGGCQNAVIRIVQINAEKKICRLAYLVHRFGDAHVTMSEQDRLRYEINPNTNHRFMAAYLSNSAYNACQVNKKRTDLPSRFINHFLSYCGDSDYKKIPAAKSIGLKVWAVAYGAAEFRLIFKDEDDWIGRETGADRVIRGPLVIADDSSPIYSRSLGLSATAADYIQSAHLVNNDGGGNLNLLLRFASPDASEMQISVTSLIRNTGAAENLKPEEKISEVPRG